jgi:hypothetical protein
MNIIDKIKNYIKSVKKNQGISYERDLSVNEFEKLWNKKRRRELFMIFFQKNTRRLILNFIFLVIGIVISINTENIIPFLVALSFSYGSVNSFLNVWSSNSIGNMKAAKLSSSSFVVVYIEYNSNLSAWLTRCKVATVSGSTLTIGSSSDPLTCIANNPRVDIIATSSTSFVVAHQRESIKDNRLSTPALYLTAGTVSGTTITLGTQKLVNDNNVPNTPLALCMLTSTTFILSYRQITYDPTEYTLRSLIGTVSGTTITLGTEKVESISNGNGGVHDIQKVDTGKVIISWTIYEDNTTWKSYARIATISGTTITYGSDLHLDVGSREVFFSVQDSSKVIGIVNNNSGYGSCMILSISGTTITKGSLVAFETVSTFHTRIDKLSSNKFIIYYLVWDSDNSKYIVKNIVANISGSNITYEEKETAYDEYKVDVNNGYGLVSLDTDKFVNFFIKGTSGTLEQLVGQVGIYTAPVEEPTVTTQSADQITTDGFRGNGNITATGGENCTRRGFCYKVGTSGDPTTSDSVAYDDGSFGTGAFTKSITGLSAGTSYRVRAYAVNSAGTSYGTTVNVTTLKAFKPRTMWFN